MSTFIQFNTRQVSPTADSHANTRFRGGDTKHSGASTRAVGEEGGCNQPPRVTSLSVGEEGGSRNDTGGSIE